MPRLTGSAATPHAAMAWSAAGMVPHATSAIPQAAHTAAPPISHFSCCLYSPADRRHATTW
jgi:hypothetical protein